MIDELKPSMKRRVRVFISSTYRDMHAEREELAKRVFPELRNFCEQRRVSLSEVDLRWGIPQEEIDAGKVLPVCLAEVENCRPFFVCLLGERYGTVLGQIPEALLQSEPWLKDHPHKSITELEVLHGALNQTSPPVHAFFYLRQPELSGTGNEFHRGVGDPSTAESKSKLEEFKERIFRSGHPVREYVTASQAGQLVFEDLRALFEHLFPEEQLPNALAQEAAAHEAFAESRRHVYVGPRRYLDRLDDYVASKQPPLVVTGGSGLGKSSLLANWARRRSSDQFPLRSVPSISDRLRWGFRQVVAPLVKPQAAADAFLVAHFAGASAEGSDWASMLRRVMEVMREHFNLSLEIPARREALPSAFANYLQAAAVKGTVILVLDGIDQLSVGEPLSKLAWLPAAVPANIRLILTVTDPEMVAGLRKRRWPVMEIKPLRSAERELLITEYLAQYRKRLEPSLLQRIASVDSTANPLYLRSVLEELRLFGRHDELTNHVEYLLAAATTEELFGRILARVEQDYVAPAPYRPELVRNAMRLIWAAREGLSESELADLLGAGDDPLPSALWSPLYIALKESLLNRSGLLSFFHEHFRRAVEKRYLPDEAEKRTAHSELADYFQRSNSLYRRLVELPWQLAATGAWPGLSALLATPEFLSAAWPTYQIDVKTYWGMIEKHSPLRMLKAYATIFENPARYRNCTLAVCTLLTDAGHVAEALRLSLYLERCAREDNDLKALEVSLNLQALLLRKRGDRVGALKLLSEHEEICRRLGDGASRAASLGNQAVVVRELGELDLALSIHREEEALCREVQDLAGLGASLGNQGVIFQEQNQPDKALALLREQERICRQLGDLAGLQKSLGNQGLVLWQTGETKKALDLLKADEGLCRQLSDRGALQVCLGNQARIFSSLADYDQALDLYRQKEDICREIGDDPELARVLLLRAHLFAGKLRQPEFALPLAEEARLVASRSGLPDAAREIDDFIRTLPQAQSGPG